MTSGHVMRFEISWSSKFLDKIDTQFWPKRVRTILHFRTQCRRWMSSWVKLFDRGWIGNIKGRWYYVIGVLCESVYKKVKERHIKLKTSRLPLITHSRVHSLWRREFGTTLLSCVSKTDSRPILLPLRPPVGNRTFCIQNPLLIAYPRTVTLRQETFSFLLWIRLDVLNPLTTPVFKNSDLWFRVPGWRRRHDPRTDWPRHLSQRKN